MVTAFSRMDSVTEYAHAALAAELVDSFFTRA
jgi:hypothetical protein